MKVILRNPTKDIIGQVLAKEGLIAGRSDLDDIDLSEYENELVIEDVIDIKDMTRIAISYDFALYRKDRAIYVINSDFSEMEVRL